MYPTIYRYHGDPPQPYVAMSQEEAERLAAALREAAGAVASIKRCLQMFPEFPGREGIPTDSVTQMHLTEGVLSGFLACHCKAHGIPLLPL